MSSLRNKTTPEVPASKKELIITTQKQQVLSKSQQAFNRLAKRIEKLQQDLTATNHLLGEKLTFYGSHIYPLEQQLVALQKQIISLLLPFYTEKKPLTKRDKHLLKEILTLQLNNIFSLTPEGPDEELKKIFEAVAGMDYAEAEKRNLEETKEAVSEMFADLGFDMDFDDLGPDLSEAEMMRKIQEMHDQLSQQAQQYHNRASTRKKTKKQLEKEEREKQAAELKNKSIGRIYKQLAKLLHPDLEQDEDQKAYKEMRMQELTTAYEKNDLHTLLRLELEWIQKEEANLEQLTEEKLKIYNELLKEQVAALEEESFMQLQHPRFQPLRHFVMFPEQLKTLNLTQKKKDFQQALKSLEKSKARLEGEEALAEVKEIISSFRQHY